MAVVFKWIAKHKDFANKILTARRIGCQTYLDKMIEELEQATNKDIAVTREKLIHYRWMASKLVAIYGDKQQVEIDQKVEITWNDPDVDKTYENEIKNVSELGS